MKRNEKISKNILPEKRTSFPAQAEKLLIPEHVTEITFATD